MDTRKIRKLIELAKETGIGELEVKSGDEWVRINTQSSLAAPPSQPTTTTAPSETPPPEKATASTKPTANTTEGHKVKSPMVGTVYLASQPGSPPLVAVGQHVNVGDTLCLIEAMKMFNKIEADKAGVISARLVNNEQPVEYEQELFIIDPDD